MRLTCDYATGENFQSHIGGGGKREIVAVTYDYANLANRFADIMDKQDQADGVGVGGTSPQVGVGTNSPAASDSGKIQFVKGRPTVVYWEEN